MEYKNFHLLIWALFLLTLCGCKDTIRIKNVGKYSNGIIKEKEYYRNKEKIPFAYIKYYETGDTMEFSRYRNTTDEEWIAYYKNGKISERVTYHHINYPDTIWNSDHTIVEYSTTLEYISKIDTVFEYSDSGFINYMQIIEGKCPDTLCCCDGIHLEFQKGKLSQRYHMKDKSSDGLHEFFYPSGKSKERISFNNCEYEGPDTSWFENGKPKYVGLYRNGRKEGQWEFWETDGSHRIVNYLNGVLDGATSEYNASQTNRWVKGQYSNGKEIGKWYFYNKDSVLSFCHIF